MVRRLLLVIPIIGFGLFPDLAAAQPLVPVACSGVNAPVSCGTCEAVQLVNNLIQFAILVSSSLALIVFIYAGFLYVTAAGNSSRISKATGFFSNVIIGYVLLLSAFLVVDLVLRSVIDDSRTSILNWRSIECIYPNRPVPTVATGSSTLGIGGGGARGGSCNVSTTGACAPSNLSCFGDTNAASRVCNLESAGGQIAIKSSTDLCKDGRSFSGGLFQINVLANHSKVPGCSGDFFTINNQPGKRPTAQGTCLSPKTNSKGVSYCAQWDCQITDVTKYNQCMGAILNEQTNIEISCGLFSNGGYNHWLTSARACNVI